MAAVARFSPPVRADRHALGAVVLGVDVLRGHGDVQEELLDGPDLEGCSVRTGVGASGGAVLRVVGSVESFARSRIRLKEASRMGCAAARSQPR